MCHDWIRSAVSLFRVEKRPNAKIGLLGYDWVEVVAIQPWALAFPDSSWGEWCDRPIKCEYICLTDRGLMRIGADDFWAALEDYGEYDERSPQSPEGKFVISAGENSVVQTGGTIEGGISFRRDSYRATGAAVAQGRSATVQADQRAVDLGALAGELAQLRAALVATASAASDFVQIGALAEAEEAALHGDESAARRSLARVGLSVLEFARKIGVEVAARAIAGSVVH